MISLLKKSFFCFGVLSITVFISYGYSDNSKKKEIDIINSENNKSEIPKDLQGLELNIALVVSDKESFPRLAFIVNNTGNKEITIPEFCESYNGIEIVKPNGKRAGLYSILSDKTRYIALKPSETKTWFMKATELLIIENTEGIYRI